MDWQRTQYVPSWNLLRDVAKPLKIPLLPNI